MTRSKRRLILGGTLVLALIVACAYLIRVAPQRLPLSLLDGMQPVKVYSTLHPNSKFSQLPGQKQCFEVPGTFDEIVAKIDKELDGQVGWGKKSVSSFNRILNYYQRFPGEKFNRWTIGVEEPWDVAAYGGKSDQLVVITIAYPTRDVGPIERAGYWLRERLGM